MTNSGRKTRLRIRFFRGLARLNVEHPFLVIFAAVLLAAVSLAYTKARLQFDTGQDALVSDNNPNTRNYLRYTHEFPDLDGAIIVVRAHPDPRRAEHFVDALARRLTADKANVKRVFYRVDPGLFSNRGLLYLSVGDLDKLSTQIRHNRQFLRDYASDPTLATFFGLLNRQANKAMTSQMMSGLLGSGNSSPSAGSNNLNLGTLNAVLGGMLAARGTAFTSPWHGLTGTTAQSGALRDGYLATENGKYLLLDVAPGDGVKDGPNPVAAIEHDIAAVRARFPGIEAGMTGGPALAYAEQESTKHDIALASAIAIISNALLVIIPFRGIVEPIFALIALLVGVSWSFGFTTVAVGHLNLLSAVFTSILAGIGINFPIHMMARYDEARRRGSTVMHGVDLAVVNTGTGVVASASIMALAFLMPVFSNFKGIAELGLVSAAGLFLCLVSALFVFPALVAIRDRNRPAMGRLTSVKPPEQSRLQFLFRRPWAILGVTAVVTAGVFVLAPRIRFDQNLLKLQAQSSQAVRYENKLLKDSGGRSSWFAVSLAKTQAQAARLAAEYRKLPNVAAAETIDSFIPDNQTGKRAILAKLKPAIDPIKVKSPAPAGNPQALARELEALKFKLGSAGALSQTAETSKLVSEALARLKADPTAFEAYGRAMAADLGRKLAQLNKSLSPGAITEANLPKVLRDRFIGTSGVYLVQVYPRGDVWADAPLHRFVTELRTVDPHVTGPPVQSYAMANVMRRGYERAAVLALIAVFIFVFADFRSLRDTMLATVPLLVGGAWLLESMVLLGWEFNLANLFAVPILIGTGVDNGVNMLYRWREERDKSHLILTKAVGKSVTIASLTTIAGFAALIPASHHGISSLGWVLSLGVTFILLATVLVLPAMFEVIGQRENAKHSATHTHTDESRRLASGGLKMLVVGAFLSVGAVLYPFTGRAQTARPQPATSVSAASSNKPATGPSPGNSAVTNISSNASEASGEIAAEKLRNVLGSNPQTSRVIADEGSAARPRCCMRPKSRRAVVNP